MLYFRQDTGLVLEEQLRKTNEILELSGQMALIGTWELDLIHQQLFWSPVTKKIHEVSEDFVPDLNTAINFYKEGESREAIERAVNHTIKTGEAYDIELIIITPSGKEKYVRGIGKAEFKMGRAVRLYGTFQDITESKKAEQNLKALSDQYQLAIEGSNDGIWDWNIQTNEAFLSKRWKSMLGYEEHEISNEFHSFSTLIFEEDRDKVYQLLQQYLKKKTSVYEVEIRMKHKNGSLRWILARGVALWGPDGTAYRMAGSHTDIHEKKIKEEESKLLLQLSQKQNDRLQNFARIVSHNLRSHSGNLQTLLDFLESDFPHAMHSETGIMLKTASSRLQETIQHLTEVAVINLNETQEINSVNLKKSVQRALENLQGIIVLNDIEIINEIKDDEYISGINAYVDSMILNVISNAIKYRSNSRKGVIKIQVNTVRLFKTLVVEDNGIGIDLEKHKDKIFGLYKTFHEHPDARGIGLFMTKNQIETMGGSIEVKSKLGEGSTFLLNFRYQPQ
jgi:PAS domain S-box-containing protein